MNRVLIVEDDTLLNTTLAYHLQGRGMGTESAFCCREAREKLGALRYDLVILDVNLPDGDGFTLCKQIQQEWKTAVIFLTANDLEKDVLKGYDLGAADYVTKPFGMGELMARMRVCLRRAGNKEGEPILTCGGLQLNLLEHRVVVEGREVKLTPTEYELLKVMLKYAGRVLTHKQLLKAVWGNEYDTDTHYIRIYMRQLRRKIEPDPAQPKYLITEAGIGYRLLGGE